MVGERNIVEIVINIVDIESGPAAIAALQAPHPFGSARNSLVIPPACPDPASTVHRHDDHGCVVKIGIMRIGILEGPTARPHERTADTPVSDNVEYLTRQQPIERLQGAGPRLATSKFEQRVTSERSVPHRRYTRLTVGLVFA